MRAIAYDSWRLDGGADEIRLVAADGSADSLLVGHPAHDWLLGWGTSSDQVVFMSDRRGSRDAYTLQIVNGKPAGEPLLLRELGHGVNVVRLTRSGDLYFRKSTRNVDVCFAKIDPASGKLQEKPIKAARVEGRSQCPAWSPDGRFLAYVISESQDGVIGIRDVESGAVRELDSITPRLSFPHWSNDGKSIYALSYSSGQCFAYQISVDTSQAKIVMKGASLVYNSWPLWSWSPDGNSFYQRRNKFVRFDILTGATNEFEIQGSGGSTVFSPECKHLVCSVTKRMRQEQ